MLEIFTYMAIAAFLGFSVGSVCYVANMPINLSCVCGIVAGAIWPLTLICILMIVFFAGISTCMDALYECSKKKNKMEN